VPILKTPPKPTLEERIRAFRDELDQFIDAKALELKADSEGVPVMVIRNLLTNRTFGCQCQSVLNLLEQ
jgi:hypothetical protein